MNVNVGLVAKVHGKLSIPFNVSLENNLFYNRIILLNFLPPANEVWGQGDVFTLVKIK